MRAVYISAKADYATRAQITIADIIRPLDGPLAEARGEKPEEAVYAGPAALLRDVWVAVLAALRDVLENVTLSGEPRPLGPPNHPDGPTGQFAATGAEPRARSATVTEDKTSSVASPTRRQRAALAAAQS